MIAHSWYDYSGRRREGSEPVQRRDDAPLYTGPKPPFERLDVAQKYSWGKSPRYDGAAMEVGPLARMLVRLH
jgi:hydrogenase large subunit